MQKKRSIKIISAVLIVLLICVSITYVKSGNKEVLATTKEEKEFNSDNLQDNEHMHVELDSSGNKVPVPNGYVGSKAKGENEIDTGYVIYEGTEEVNDDNVEEAQKTRNQYVWIPVPDASKMYGIDENGKKWGKLYTFTTETGTNIDPVTGAKPLNWSESEGVIKVSGSKEPNIYVKNNGDIDKNLKNMKVQTNRLLILLEKEFNSMIESMNNYGGFYIGRYETGNLSQKSAVIRKGNVDISNQTWYTMYNLCKKLKTKNINIETGMIWGCQYDRILIWLIESGNKNKEDICKNSSSCGNYKDSNFFYTNNNGVSIEKKDGKSISIPTGSSEKNKNNNIYDLAGNMWEWTCEENVGRMWRGGSCGYNGTQWSLSSRSWGSSITGAYDIGCRAMLYIK